MVPPAIGSPEDDASAHADGKNNPAHSRAYQACEGCRSRKVRCVMGTGDVDRPAGPPCNRCMREQKECVFSETRRKRRGGEDDLKDEADEWDQSYNQPYESPPVEDSNGRPGRAKKVRRSFPVRASVDGQPDIADEYDGFAFPSNDRNSAYAGLPPIRSPPTSAYANGTGSIAFNTAPPIIARPIGQTTTRPSAADEDHSVATLQHHEVFSRHGMMGMLIRAAEQADGGAGQADQPVNTILVDPLMTSPPTAAVEPSEKQLAAWKRLKFVRSGWFRAREGIAYIDYFYKHMLPLTPICLPDYNDPVKQMTLLEQERILLVAILCITSRYMKLSGQAAHTRAAKIHDKLWSELHSMLGRLWLAQEQFGGGLCGAGADSTSSFNQLRYQGMRTIGTIEALLLLTEWNPRALHFPPESDDEDFLLPEVRPTDDDEKDMATMLLNGTGGERKESWLEPLWRSDRMSWMLLNASIALAMEIGIFEDTTPESFSIENPAISMPKIQAFFKRKNYLRELLPVYFIQLAGRLEFINKLPPGYMEALSSKTGAEERINAFLDEFNGVATPGFVAGASPGTSYKDYQDPQHVLLYFWQEIAAIMKSGNQEMFYNGQASQQLVKDGRYSQLIDLFTGPLERWQKDFAECIAENDFISPRMRNILQIEFECARVHLNSLAMQAVVDRCIHNTPPPRYASLNGQAANRQSPSPRAAPIPPSTLMKWSGEDRKYVNQVLEAGRNVLRIVVEDLLPGDVLKHIPVRTYSRIIAVQIILCKAIFFGAYEAEMISLFNLIDRAMEALETCNVDDVHISNQFAAMCKAVLKRVRSKLIRISASGNLSSRADSPSVSGRSPNPNSIANRSTFGLPMGPSNHMLGNNLAQVTDPTLLLPTGDFSASNNPASILLPFSVGEYDPQLHSVMPPPDMYQFHEQQFGAGSSSNNNNNNGSSSNDGGQPIDDSAAFLMENVDKNWITGELDSLFMHQGADVTSTHFGPALNGMDLLDFLVPPDPAS